MGGTNTRSACVALGLQSERFRHGQDKKKYFDMDGTHRYFSGQINTLLDVGATNTYIFDINMTNTHSV